MKKINLALQGGGAHGAYTWGVIDRLLEENDIEIEGISGTSAGAMNAAILAHGYCKGGKEGARAALDEFWKAVSKLGSIKQTPLDRMLYGWNLDGSMDYHMLDAMSRILSPYEFNPMNINVLQGVLEKMIDFDALKNSKDIKLFISATNVQTGRARVFNTEEVTVKVLLASACLPFMFQSVEINNHFFWDGGYMGNPSLWPLIYGCDSKDVLLVQINPLIRHKMPVKAHEIINRVSEISFNASLIAEMRAIHFVSKMITNESLDKNVYKHLRMHMIESSEAMQELNASSKMNTSWEFFVYLKNIGRNAADAWIQANMRHVGKISSLDIEQVFFPALLEEHPYLEDELPCSALALPDHIKRRVGAGILDYQ